MFRRHSTVWIALIGTCLIASAGCQQESAPPTPAVTERPGPEASFAEIVELFKNGMELPGSNLSNVFTQDAGSSSRIQVHNTVTSQLIPPSNAEDFYRGTITVSTQSMYSMRRTNDNDDKDESADDESPNAAANKGFGDGETEEGQFQSFDPGLVANPPDGEKEGETNGATSVQRRPEKDDRTYELIYREDRWQLITKLDPKTERSVANAFDRALRNQP